MHRAPPSLQCRSEEATELSAHAGHVTAAPTKRRRTCVLHPTRKFRAVVGWVYEGSFLTRRDDKSVAYRLRVSGLPMRPAAAPDDMSRDRCGIVNPVVGGSSPPATARRHGRPRSLAQPRPRLLPTTQLIAAPRAVPGTVESVHSSQGGRSWYRLDRSIVAPEASFTTPSRTSAYSQFPDVRRR